ncbi:MAG: hypothetical protein ACRD3W_29620, partial [Terriglobales bacterium]
MNTVFGNRRSKIAVLAVLVLLVAITRSVPVAALSFGFGLSISFAGRPSTASDAQNNRSQRRKKSSDPLSPIIIICAASVAVASILQVLWPMLFGYHPGSQENLLAFVAYPAGRIAEYFVNSLPALLIEQD